MSYEDKVAERHRIGPKARAAFREISKFSKRDEMLAWITESLKRPISPELVKDFCDLMMSRKKWSAPRLVRVFECGPLRKLFLLWLANVFPRMEPHRGKAWIVACIKEGDARCPQRAASVVGHVQRRLALERLAQLGVDITSL